MMSVVVVDGDVCGSSQGCTEHLLYYTIQILGSVPECGSGFRRDGEWGREAELVSEDFIYLNH